MESKDLNLKIFQTGEQNSIFIVPTSEITLVRLDAADMQSKSECLGSKSFN